MAKKTFEDFAGRIIPNREQLDELGRDLTFKPVPTASPETLTAEEIARYNHEGYLKPYRIFDESEISNLRGHLDAILEQIVREGGDSYSFISAHLRDGRIYDLIHDSRILRYVRDILGNDFVCWSTHCFCKMPHDGKQVSWHQDASYWPLSPARTVTMWLAIDDADSENACMRFIPRSHLVGHIDYRTSDASEQNVLNQTVDDVERFGDPVDVTLKAGEASLHSDLLLHGSEANNSDRRRCGLTMRFAAAEVQADYGWNNQGVLVSGVDARGHWGNPPRPEAN